VDRVKTRSLFATVLANLGWPLCWGLLLWLCFYMFIHQGIIESTLVIRYFAGHPVEYLESAMFFVGMAALVIKMFNVAQQYIKLPRIGLEPVSTGGQPVEDCQTLIEQLDEALTRVGHSILGNRLLNALEYVRRKGSADGLDEELKYLAETDAIRLQEGNGLVRIIVWAIPIMGFLGTVIGITLALGGLSPQMLVDTPEQAMEGLLAGLSVAFDTTALALTLSILLMFCMFLTEQFESQIMAMVDTRSDAELVGRFEEYGAGNDPQTASIRRMTAAVIDSSEALLTRQTDLWRSTIDDAHQHWSRLVDTAGNQFQAALGESLTQSLQAHAQQMSHSEMVLAEQNREHWNHVLQALNQCTSSAQAQQTEITRQTAVLHEVVSATGDVVTLEKALNDNLQFLAGSNNFEQTVMSLAAAIHLLNARLAGGTDWSPPQIDLTQQTSHHSSPKDRAA